MAGDKEKLFIFDTTLRDGEQSPGVTLNAQEKVDIARQLSRLGVDICEAGFPVASVGDFEAVSRIAHEVGPLTEGRPSGEPMVIAALARAHEKDIDRAFEAVKDAPRHRIHTFLATSDIHLEFKLRISREACVEKAVKAVRYAKAKCADIEFSPEDAGRSDREFLVEVIGKVIEAGATTINIPDTVGYTTPQEYGELIAYLRSNTKGGEGVVWSTHCHNDLGLATSNSLAGVLNGARQVEVAVNGIGERAGNTALEEIVMAVATRPAFFPVRHDVDTTQLIRTSRLVAASTGMSVQPNKAIVGANAFAHESGIHQDGMLKNAMTYEIMRPESVGLSATSLVLGKHSGRHAFRDRLNELGYGDLTDDDVNKSFARFKELADEKKTLVEEDILAILDDVLDKTRQYWTLVSVHVSCGDKLHATATVHLRSPDGADIMDAAIGDGPIDAVYKAVDRAVALPIKLDEFHVSAVTSGQDALGRVKIRIEVLDPAMLARPGDELQGLNGEKIIASSRRFFTGHAADTDIIVASARAYVAAINRMCLAQSPPSTADRKSVV